MDFTLTNETKTIALYKKGSSISRLTASSVANSRVCGCCITAGQRQSFSVIYNLHAKKHRQGSDRLLMKLWTSSLAFNLQEKDRIMGALSTKGNIN